MKLRDRQVLFRDRCVAAIAEHRNTLGVAPTGAGKTVMLSAIAGTKPLADGPQLILQHRDELVSQNRTTFELINPRISTGLYTADRKETAYGAIFGMVQTLARQANLDTMPPFHAIHVDEAHHAAADSYRRIIDHFQKLNPNLLLFGATATPTRGDKKALRGVFTNCADQITLKELIEARHLVPPRTFVVDIGVRDALAGVRKTINDFDMTAVEAIMDKHVLNERIIEEWRRVAGDRQTVVFCSTVQHAEHVAEAYRASGVTAAAVAAEMGAQARRETLEAYDRGAIQVLTNVMVLTEGWDHQPTSCVILLRPSSFKSTMIQMIGRGLRKVDPERYPGRQKDNCVVMDFGTSILQHGDLDQDVLIEGEGTKPCPECTAVVPIQSRECPICGYEFPRPPREDMEKACKECGEINPLNARQCSRCGEPFGAGADPVALVDFNMTEVDLLADSPYYWQPLFGGLVMAAQAFDAWVVCVSYHGRWHAIGGSKSTGLRSLADNDDRLFALASADDFLREYGDSDGAGKTRSWLYQPPSTKQLEALHMSAAEGIGLTRYEASCLLTWKFNERGIRKKLEMAPRLAA